jgi:hypothetical protein
MPELIDCAEGRLDQLPATLVLERLPDSLCNECAAAPHTHPRVQLPHQCIVESYVHTHVLNLAHRTFGLRDAKSVDAAPEVGWIDGQEAMELWLDLDEVRTKLRPLEQASFEHFADIAEILRMAPGSSFASACEQRSKWRNVSRPRAHEQAPLAPALGEGEEAERTAVVAPPAR